jgi:hypothetical protein
MNKPFIPKQNASIAEPYDATELLTLAVEVGSGAVSLFVEEGRTTEGGAFVIHALDAVWQVDITKLKPVVF